MIRFMTLERTPTRDELARVLDDIFRRVLDDGERTRAEREPGMPPWVPEPQTDPLYEGLEPEDWDKVPSTPELWASEWRDAVLTNRVGDVATLVDDALEAGALEVPREGPSWRRFVRLALLAAAEAHNIDAQRETGDYSAGWPGRCGIPPEQVPLFGAEAKAGESAPPPVITEARGAASGAAASPAFSASYAEFMAQKPAWTAKTRAQAEAVLQRFISLMDDRPVSELSQSIADRFKQRLRQVPALNGKSIYSGRNARDCIPVADRIAKALEAGDVPIRVGSLELDEARARARRLAERLSLKTINRDLTFLSDWGKWMEGRTEKRPLLHDQRNPFAGLLHKKSDVEKESRRSGRKRVGFSQAEVALVLANLPVARPDEDAGSDRDEARRWAVRIALYSGMRLGEIVQLRARDFKREDGVDFIDLNEDAGRQLKSEAGARRIPVHPALVELGLLSLARARRTSRSDFILARSSGEATTDAAASSISKWFLPWRTALGIIGASKPFHATRHTFGDALRASSLGRDALVDQLLGHEPGGVGAKVYTRPLPLSEKAALVGSIRYGMAGAAQHGEPSPVVVPGWGGCDQAEPGPSRVREAACVLRLASADPSDGAPSKGGRPNAAMVRPRPVRYPATPAKSCEPNGSDAKTSTQRLTYFEMNLK